MPSVTELAKLDSFDFLESYFLLIVPVSQSITSAGSPTNDIYFDFLLHFFNWLTQLPSVTELAKGLDSFDFFIRFLNHQKCPIHPVSQPMTFNRIFTAFLF